MIITSALIVVISGRRPFQRDVERIFSDALHPQIEDSARRSDVGARRKALRDEDCRTDGLTVERRSRNRFPEAEVAAATFGGFHLDVVGTERF
jgi:hypothetical protein